MSSKPIARWRVLLLALGACSYSPRNNQPLAHSTDTLTWAGGDLYPNVAYALAYADGQRVTQSSIIAIVNTASQPSKDDVGTNWYGWSQNLKLPGTPALWKVTGTNKMAASLRTVKMADVYSGSAQAVPLSVFDFGAATDSCIQANSKGGGAQVVDKCKSSSGGIVTVTAPCGTRGEACCPVSSTWFSDPRSCSTGLACSFSGGLGECLTPLGGACSASNECGGGASCIYGVCSSSAEIQFGSFSTTTRSVRSEIYQDVPGANANGRYKASQNPGESLMMLTFNSKDQGKAGGGDPTHLGSYWTCLPQTFTRLVAAPGQARTGTVRPDPLGYTVGQAIRYVHGSCSTRVPWKENFFDNFSSVVSRVMKERVEAMQPKIGSFTSTREYDYAQPQFSGNGNRPSWGFWYAAKMRTDVYLGVKLMKSDLYINPGYAFEPDAQGFVDVRALTAGVVVTNNMEWLNDDLASLKSNIASALTEMAPTEMEKQIRSRMERPISELGRAIAPQAPGINTTCDPSAALAVQQSSCFDQIVPALAFLQVKGADALEPKNFTCLRSRECAFHPIVQQVNVLPDALELVFSPSITDTAGPDELRGLYQSAGICGAAEAPGVYHGTPALMYHENGIWNTACGALLQ